MAVEMVLTLGQAFEVAYQLALLKNSSTPATETTAVDDVANKPMTAVGGNSSSTSFAVLRRQVRPRTTPPLINSVKPLHVKALPQTAAIVATDRL